MTTENPVSFAARATAFALEQGLIIVSDLYGHMFVVQQEGQQAFKIARLKLTAKGGAALGSRTYASLDHAVAYMKERTGYATPTVRVASIPDQVVVQQYCAEHRAKATDHVHSGYVAISVPIRDKMRKWEICRRVGTTLMPLSKITVRDQWGARAAVERLGGREVTAELTGPFKFPYGDGYGKRPKVSDGDGDGDSGNQSNA